uniref:Col_cuticle_N domain-containing protein n=1 Tax=Trichuris muris TaxID=70415 RepID=A0A5S6R475_TRIMR
MAASRSDIRFFSTISVLLSLLAISVCVCMIPLILMEISSIDADLVAQMELFSGELGKIWEEILTDLKLPRKRRQAPTFVHNIFASDAAPLANETEVFQSNNGSFVFNGNGTVVPSEGGRAMALLGRTAKKRCNCRPERASKCLPGPQGPPGVRGEPGLDGTPGKNGQNGMDAPAVHAIRQHMRDCLKCASPGGAEGPVGNPGPQGIRGSTGRPGSNGADGAPGVPGENGLPGLAGPPGQAGPRGTNGTDAGQIVGVRGNPGERGPIGDIGPKGRPGSDRTSGEQGDAGEVGPPGDIGPIGHTGPSGPAGIPGLPGADATYCLCPARTRIARPVTEEMFILKSKKHRN